MAVNFLADLPNRFCYHSPPDHIAVGRHAAIRQVLLKAAEACIHEVTEGVGDAGGREVAVALTNLEQAMFWFNAALARNWP